MLIGSQAHWNLRRLRGLPLALDPTLQWHSDSGRNGNVFPKSAGLHGMWDDSPLAANPNVAVPDYIQGRIEDLHGLLPSAVEWMVDIATIEHLTALGTNLGKELDRRGVALSAWTLRADEGAPADLLSRLYHAGVETVITDVPLTSARAAASLTSTGRL